MKKVLLIDDEGGNEHKVLLELIGVRVELFCTLEDGLDFIKANDQEIGLVLLDYWGTCDNSGGKNRSKLVKELLKICEPGSIPVYSTSSDSDAFYKYEQVIQINYMRKENIVEDEFFKTIKKHLEL